MGAIDKWIGSAVGRAMNPDKTYGLQCKDVIDDYCIALFGNWTNTIRPGNAKDCFANSNPANFRKIAYVAGSIPPRGAIICWDGNMGGGAGHIAVVENGSANSFSVIEQDGFKQVPAYRNTYFNYRYVQGWLIPLVEDEVMTKEQAAKLALFIRLLAFNSVEKANANSAEDTKQILANPGYAADFAEFMKNTEWQLPAYKAAHYDEDVAAKPKDVPVLTDDLTISQLVALIWDRIKNLKLKG